MKFVLCPVSLGKIEILHDCMMSVSHSIDFANDIRTNGWWLHWALYIGELTMSVQYEMEHGMWATLELWKQYISQQKNRAFYLNGNVHTVRVKFYFNRSGHHQPHQKTMLLLNTIHLENITGLTACCRNKTIINKSISMEWYSCMWYIY